MVQVSKAERIRDEWVRKGRPRCAHEHYDKEYYLGSDTGDYACTTSGITWPRGSDKPPPEPRDDE
jgi:hypothetical protein